MLKFIFAALIFMAGFAPALAQECTPVAQLQRHAIDELHVASTAVFSIEGLSEVAKYRDAVGAPMPPADSAPKGLFVVEGTSIAYVGIIEQAGCVRYSLAVPLPVHFLALAKIMKGA